MGAMLILSPVNPDAGFQTGVAMMRNKFIYAQSDATVVVRSENGKGGTWAGAIENLRHRWSPLYCWERPDYAGNAALIEKGAIAINETWNGDISASAYWQDNITTQTNIASNGKQLSMWDAGIITFLTCLDGQTIVVKEDGMKITKDLKKQIESDIAMCESHSEVNGSESLYSILVARYTVLDAAFGKNLSSSGKTAAVNHEFDFRPELRAIAAKLQMWLLTAPTDQDAVNSLKDKVDSFISRGETIKQVELQPATKGFPVSFVSGPRFDKWMGEINILNERYLKNHPIYDSIRSTYALRDRKPSACNDMLGHLRALSSDEEFFRKEVTSVPNNSKSAPINLQDMLAEDISLCEQFIANPTNQNEGRKLYTKVTSRYDSVIEGFGNGLYQYTSELHFYDPDIDSDTLEYNLQVLIGKCNHIVRKILQRLCQMKGTTVCI